MCDCIMWLTIWHTQNAMSELCVFTPVHSIFQVHMPLGTRTSRAYPNFRFLAAHRSIQSSLTPIKQQNISHPSNNKFIKYEYNYDCCLLSEVLLNITELIDFKALSKAKERPVDTVHTLSGLSLNALKQ